MLYEAIRVGCQIYHESGRSYDEAYVDYLSDRDPSKWDHPNTLDYGEVDRLVSFANKWKCRMPSSPGNVGRVLGGLRRVVPDLNLLKSNTLLDVRFDQNVHGTRVSQLITVSFDKIAKSSRNRSGPRYESVATSKMIHAAINPSLFVMWDNKIQKGLGYRLNNRGHGYAQFLAGMQRLAERAITQVIDVEGYSRDDAIMSLSPCGHSFVKVLDEFNYAKFTLENPAVHAIERRT